MAQPEREYYGLEKLWSEAPLILRVLRIEPRSRLGIANADFRRACLGTDGSWGPGSSLHSIPDVDRILGRDGEGSKLR